jgi:cell wall-associated NlpC family hydrolase
MNSGVGFDDLVGLPYQWGARPQDGACDCWQLAAEALHRYTGIDWRPRFEWVYQAHGQELPCGLLLRLLDRHTTPGSWQPGALGFLPTAGAGALSTVTEYGLLLIGPAERVVHLPRAFAPRPRRLYQVNPHG